MLIFSLWSLLTYTVAFITAYNGTAMNSSATSFTNATSRQPEKLLMTSNVNLTSNAAISSRWSPSRQIFRLITSAPRADGRRNNWGPFFEEGAEPKNITARLGSTVEMDCKVALLHDKTVNWLHRKGGVMYLLTVGKEPYSTDQHVLLTFQYPNNWRLKITSVTKEDDGIYECQVSTHPTTVKRVYLTVTAPEVEIVDEKGSAVSERYYKAGSQVELTCHASQMEMPEDNLTWWKADTLLSEGITTNISVSDGNAESVLLIEQALKQHSGNYSCVVGQLATSSVLVHVLNGELPAAVYDGSSGSVSSSFTATWLIILSFTVGIDDAIYCR